MTRQFLHFFDQGQLFFLLSLRIDREQMKLGVNTSASYQLPLSLLESTSHQQPICNSGFFIHLLPLFRIPQRKPSLLIHDSELVSKLLILIKSHTVDRHVLLIWLSSLLPWLSRSTTTAILLVIECLLCIQAKTWGHGVLWYPTRLQRDLDLIRLYLVPDLLDPLLQLLQLLLREPTSFHLIYLIIITIISNGRSVRLTFAARAITTPDSRTL